MAKNNIIDVLAFGEEVGRVGYNLSENRSSFQYNADFLKVSDMENLFPFTGIIKRVAQPQSFSIYNNKTFKGLPPPIADSLPDNFGNLIFKTWLKSSTKSEEEISVIEQLAYIGNRGMGALEYRPGKEINVTSSIDLTEIIAVLKSVLDLKSNTQQAKLNNEALLNIFKIGTSAGGARPKILISENKKTREIIPGDLKHSLDYHHYLVKLSLEEAPVYPRERVEYCYYLTARNVGIAMMDSKLIDNRHFATLRFDRQDGEKQHILTATGITGWDFTNPENSSYENLFKLSSFLKISQNQMEALFRRMVFNVIFKNMDDHLKNHSFIYSRQTDSWSLAPAYDLTFSLNPLLDFRIANHALSINRKRNNIQLKDVIAVADLFTVQNPIAIIREVQRGIEMLYSHLSENQISPRIIEAIHKKITPLI